MDKRVGRVNKSRITLKYFLRGENKGHFSAFSAARSGLPEPSRCRGTGEPGDPGGGEGKWLRRADEALPSAIRVDDGWGWIGLTRP